MNKYNIYYFQKESKHYFEFMRKSKKNENFNKK